MLLNVHRDHRDYWGWAKLGNLLLAFISVWSSLQAYNEWGGGGGLLFLVLYFTLVCESNRGNESGVVLIILSWSL